MLHTLPKDILVKLIETVQKDYCTYLVAHYEGCGQVSIDTFDNEESLKEYLLDHLCMNNKPRFRTPEQKHKFIDENLHRYTLKQLINELSSLTNDLKVIKGKLLL